jgi:hypothetical protein
MLAAVQAGDISTAQSALTSLQSDTQSAGYTPDSTSTSANSSSPQTDLDALFQAVKTGDATSAQAALTKLQSDSQDATQQTGDSQSGQKAHGHHHHRHGGGGGGIEAAVAQAFDSTSSTSSSTSATGDASDVADPMTTAGATL